MLPVLGPTAAPNAASYDASTLLADVNAPSNSSKIFNNYDTLIKAAKIPLSRATIINFNSAL